LGEAVAEVVHLGVAAHVDEWQDGERSDGRGGLFRRARLGGTGARGELGARLRNVREPGAAIFLQTATKKIAQGDRCVDGQVRPRRLDCQDARDHFGDACAAERPPAGDELEHQTAERPDVRALIDGFAAQLLGTHVGGRAGEIADARHRGERRRFGGVAGRFGIRGELREAEVEHFHASVRRNFNVGGFDVAMRDALSMR
jgi:hypothetical protein